MVFVIGWTLKPSHSRISPMWPMVGTVTSRMGMNGTELKEEEAGFSLGGCCGEEERPPVVDCHLTKEQGIPPGVIFPSLVT